ncbi:MAG: succinate dehydrogenase cytochrome b subunit [Verrucomicrobia bacterium]|nr:succinate dehydrogenase cytochrome b subunit [Verrucomicrobiota bacterium]
MNSSPGFLGFFKTSIGRKWVVALTGLFLIFFVIVHMAGNLQMFAPTPDTINRYAELLKSNALVLWGFRAALLVATVLHIWGALSLARENRAAKPMNYAVTGRKARLGLTWASVTMVISGTVILGFVVFHLLHFTAQVVDRSYQEMEAVVDGRTMHDVHRMVVVGFSKPLISGFYVLAMGLLFFHLRHGAASVFQTIGIRDRALSRLIENASWALAVILFVGFSSIPVAVLLGVWKL